MTLAVADGLLAALANAPLTADLLAPRLMGRFIHWATSPENDRSPGQTCMRAINGLIAGQPWLEATQRGSKGCGANMRVVPMGLAGLTDDQRAGAAQLQAALTHGHPTGLAASELTAFAVHWLRDGLDPRDLPAALRQRCHDQRTTYRGEWLSDLWHGPGVASPEDFIARGWDECLAVLNRLDAALANRAAITDPCQATGDGWIAEEALATAVLAFLLHVDDPVAALGRAAATNGDSDSIACLTGAMAGATYGMGAWPAEWAERIEYKAELRRLGAAWD
jgi:ADP-ribosylglycohydrolase